MMAGRKAQWNMKGKKPTLKQFVCEDCGEDFWRAANVAKYCDVCREERMAENKARSAQRRVKAHSNGRSNYESLGFVVRHDPDAVSGFGAGARLGEYDVKMMLKFGYFTVGTLLFEEKHTRTWQVWKVRGKQTLMLWRSV